MKGPIFLIVTLLLLICVVSCEGNSKCRDKERRCKQLASEGNCFRDKELRKKCPDSCGLCRSPAEDAILETVKESHERAIWYMAGVVVCLLFSVFILWIRLRNVGGVCLSKGSMKGKLVVITGATSGIGVDTAFHLALRGARIVIGCRNLKKGFKMAKDLRNQTQQKFIEVRKLDLESFDSIKEFATAVNEEFPKIDVLINNAGILSGRNRGVTEDGHERTFQTNYLGHFYLTKLFINNMKENSPSRIINVVSDEFKKGQLDFKNLQGLKQFNNMSAYRNANLALMYFTKELSNLLKDAGVTVNAANPGLTATNLWQDVFPYSWKITWFLLSPYSYMFWKSTSMGAETSYYCALDRDLSNVTGKYFEDCKEVEFPELDDEIGRKLWAVSERLLTPKKMSTLNQAAIKKALNEIVEAESAKDRGDTVEEVGNQATNDDDDEIDGTQSNEAESSQQQENENESATVTPKSKAKKNDANSKKKEKGSPHPKKVDKSTTSKAKAKTETVTSSSSTSSVRKRNTTSETKKKVNKSPSATKK